MLTKPGQTFVSSLVGLSVLAVTRRRLIPLCTDSKAVDVSYLMKHAQHHQGMNAMKETLADKTTLGMEISIMDREVAESKASLGDSRVTKI